MITAKQITVVHLAKARLGLEDDMYREILQKLGGVASAKQLDAAGFEAVMEYFASCGFQSTWRKRTFGNRPGMATPPQVDLIRGLWRDFSGADDEAALNKWLERSFHITALRFLDKVMAQKAITGLKKMLARKATAA
jgi:phage gp16-like protein